MIQRGMQCYCCETKEFVFDSRKSFVGFDHALLFYIVYYDTTKDLTVFCGMTLFHVIHSTIAWRLVLLLIYYATHHKHKPSAVNFLGGIVSN